MAKRSLNLSVGHEALDRGQRYSRRHGVSVSSLVEDFLAQLPVEDESAGLSWDVRSLIGVGAGQADRESYRRHLKEKYGR